MSIEAWRAIAKRFGMKYGVEVHLGGTRAYATEKAIFLPGDVPTDMQEVLHGLFLHEKEHILQKDCEFMRVQDRSLMEPLNITQDIHNDNLVHEQDPGYLGMWRKIMEYMDAKEPREVLYSMPWQKQAAYALLLKGHPRELSEGFEFTKDPCVKHLFHKHAGKIRRMLRDLRDLRPNHEAQLKWAKWLLEQLFASLIQQVAEEMGIPQPAAGEPGTQLPEEILKAIAEKVEEMGGLTPQKRTPNNFECISPGDLCQKVPEKVTVQRLKEFLTEEMSTRVQSEDGSIDPAMLPQYQTDPDGIFKQEEDNKTKKIRVYLLLDASGSMAVPMEDGNQRKDALMRATGLVCQAADRIVRDEGYDIEVEAWAFGESDRMIKTGGERWDPYTFKQRYWRGGGDDDTCIASLLKTVAEYPESADLKSVVLLITDGTFHDAGKPELDAAMASGGKHWVLIGLGNQIPDPKSFRFVANTMNEVEYILCQAVKEGLAQ